jgi:hypothetical protein
VTFVEVYPSTSVASEVILVISRPSGPVSPGSPFKFLKSNAKVLSRSDPPGVTVTEGVPTLASTVAVTPVILAEVPFAPLAPFLTLMTGLVDSSVLLGSFNLKVRVDSVYSPPTVGAEAVTDAIE